MTNPTITDESVLAELISLWQSRRAEGSEVSLTELCRNRSDLLSELQQRIAVLERMKGLADASYSMPTVSHDGTTADPLAPQPPTVGETTSAGLRFRVLRPHAKGGLGEVFVAQDTELRREVALKEIQYQFADDLNSRSRFVMEAEITGGLEHPGIVPVYGLGTYADGRPYYAMRFIRGDSLQDAITRFHQADTPSRDASERALSLRQLLGRFLAVCNAIDYAHSRGVLHRDLKPANVMLGKYGETLVVDWGLAKTLSQPEGAAEAAEVPLRPSPANGSTPTQMGSVMGTPEYMSPEQAAGRLDQMGPASDVYSLGATLYCLLTGVAPFQRKRDLGAMLQRVQRGEFRPPRQVKREVPAALEAVCLKAMALKPQDRYASPRALATDVERWLADEPVSAWREPLRVRVGRWARRHQTLMAASATGVLVLVLAAGTGGWWLDRQRTEQRRGVESALVEVERLQEQGRWSEARAVMGQARERLGQSGSRDLQQRLDQGERNLDLVARLDAIRLKRATWIEDRFDNKGADREYEEAFRDWGGIEANSNVEAAATLVCESTVRDALLAALDDWAICANERQRLTWLLSVAQAADADPWRKRLRDPAFWQDKAVLVHLMTEGELSEQSPQLLAALGERLRQLGGDNEPVLRTARQRHPGDFWINFDLGNALRHKRPSDAVGYYLAALAVRPGTPAVHNNLGVTLRHMGRFEEAVAECRKALELDPKFANAHISLGNVLHVMRRLKEAVVEYHKAIELDPKDAKAHYNLGCALHDMGRSEEAGTACRKAIELDPKLALAHDRLGIILYDTRRLKEAVAEFHKAIELDPKDAKAHSNLGNVMHAMRRFEEAVAECRKAIEIDPKLALAHNNLGNALRDMGRHEEAVAEYRKAIELDPKDAKSHYNLGLALHLMGQLKEVVAEYRKAIELNPKDALAHYNLGCSLHLMGRLEEAAAEYRKAIELDPKDAKSHNNLGLALSDMRRLKEAIAEFHKTIELDPKDAKARTNLGYALRHMGRHKEAVAEFHKAIELDPKLVQAHYNLGLVLYDMRRFEEASAEHHKTIELDPKDAKARNNLGLALSGMRRLEEAIVEYHKAIELDSKDASPHFNLGNALRDLRRHDEAIACYRKALELKPGYAEAHCNLGHTLFDQGRFTEAVAVFRRGHELGSKNPPWPYPSAQWLRQAERMPELDAKMQAILQGNAKLTDTVAEIDLVDLTRLCQIKQRYAAAVRFFTAAFAAQPKLADDLRASHRYNAACYAALAAAGQGKDAAKLDYPERAGLRQQARDWLRADLALWTKQIEKGTPEERTAAQKQLRHWQQDTDLACLRDKDAVDKLPEGERTDCRKLWDEVAALLKKTEAKKE